MQIVILSGGTGKGLWPLSNAAYSKQFLRLLDGESDCVESILQRTSRLIKKSNINAEVTITASNKHIDSIMGQLGADTQIVIEPESRDTFPAVALASSYLLNKKGCSPDEVVIFLPCDTYTDIDYFDAIEDVANLIKKEQVNIALLGIKPQFASERWGYIISDDCYRVTNFVEKPSLPEANRLIEEGALLNAGVFAFRLGYMNNIISKYNVDNSYDGLLSKYSELPKTSFDYEVLEQENSIGVVPFYGTWNDLDTWKSLTEHMRETSLGNVIGDNNGSHIINESGVPVVALGCNNLAIVATPDGILVCDKEHSEQLKVYADKIATRPMYEKRRWGSYKVLNHERFDDGYEALTKLLYLNAGCNISYQYHAKRDEIWTFIDGNGLLIVDGEQIAVTRGYVAHIKAGQKHAVRAITDLQIIEVQSGAPLVEEDIFRLDWPLD